MILNSPPQSALITERILLNRNNVKIIIDYMIVIVSIIEEGNVVTIVRIYFDPKKKQRTDRDEVTTAGALNQYRLKRLVRLLLLFGTT